MTDNSLVLVLCMSRTSRRRWRFNQTVPSGSAGVWSRWPLSWAAGSPAATFGQSELLTCTCTSSAATTILWRVTCSGHRSTRPIMEHSATSGRVKSTQQLHPKLWKHIAAILGKKTTGLSLYNLIVLQYNVIVSQFQVIIFTL